MQSLPPNAHSPQPQCKFQIYRLTDAIRDAAFTGAGNALISASRSIVHRQLGTS
jgi:hypothetical protein